MARIIYSAAVILQQKLLEEISLDCGISGPDENGKFTIHYPPDTPAEVQAKGDAIAAAWPNTNYITRLCWDILQDLQQMQPEWQQQIFGDLWTNTWPPKIAQSEGANFPGIWSLYCTWVTVTTTPEEADQARLYGTALYIQDHPAYLMNPPFNPDIYLPGVEPYSGKDPRALPPDNLGKIRMSPPEPPKPKARKRK